MRVCHQCRLDALGISDGVILILRLGKGHNTPKSIISPSAVFGEDTTG